MFRRMIWIELLFSVLITSLSQVVSAQVTMQSKSKEYNLILPFAAGGDTDKVALTIAPLLSRYLNTPVKVEYISGEFGRLGLDRALSRSVDDKQIVLTSMSGIVLSEVVQDKPRMQWKDFEVIKILSLQPLMCATSMQSSIKSWRDLIDKVRKDKGKITMVSAGPYTHLFPAYTLRLLGVRYDGIGVAKNISGSALIEQLMENKGDLICTSIPTLAPYVKQGKVRGLFSNSIVPIEELPNLPTAKDIQLRELSRFMIWTCIMVKKGTPKSEIQRIQNALVKVSDDPEWLNSSVVKYGASAIKSIQNPTKFIEEEYAFYENLAVLSRLIH